MRIVITGASGNIGTALLRRLAAEPDHDIVGISRHRPPEIAPYDAASWHEIDLGAPEAAAALTQVLAGADAVVHLAWLIQPGRDRDLLRRVNQGGTRAVIDAARAAGVGHLVHISSVGTYAAAHGQWRDESWSTRGIPTSSYSVDKAAGEAMLDDLAPGVPAVARVRPALVLQPDAAGEISRYFIGRLLPVRALRDPVLRWAPLPRDFWVQFVHADDVADAIARVLQQRATGAFNIAADPPIDRAAFGQLFGGPGPALPWSVLRVGADLSWRARLQPTDAGWVDLAASLPLMRTERARDVLGWTPRHAADETLRTFVEALRSGQGGAGPKLYPRNAL